MSMRLIDPVVPDIARDLLVTPGTVALLASAFAIPYALAQPVLGSLGDTVGKALVIKTGLAILAASLAVSAVAQSVEMLYAARIVGGAAAGGIIPLAFAVIGDRFEMGTRQVALSRLLSAIIAGQLTGSIGSGWLASASDWRMVMLVSAAVSAAALTLTMVYLKPNPNIDRLPFTLLGMRKAYGEVLQNPIARVGLPAVFIEGIVIFGLLPFVAVLLEQRGAGGVREAGFVLAGFGIGGLLYTATVKLMLPRIGVDNLIRYGALLTAVGYTLLTLSVSWPKELAIFVVIGVGFYMIHNSLQTIATEFSTRHRAAGVAAHAFFFFIGQAFGPIIYRLMFASVGSEVTLVIMALVFAGLGLATVVGLNRVRATPG